MVETLVIDDGSTDGTAEVARPTARPPRALPGEPRAGARVLRRPRRRPQARRRRHRQHRRRRPVPGLRHLRLVQPILTGQADMVIGDRAPHRALRAAEEARSSAWGAGWWRASGTRVPDAARGFRAFSRGRAAAERLHRFTYTLETIIQAGKKTFPSRMFRSGRTPSAVAALPGHHDVRRRNRPRSYASTRSTSRSVFFRLGDPPRSRERSRLRFVCSVAEGETTATSSR